MKKIVLFLGFLLITLSACGNKKILDFTYTFNYAQIKIPDGSIVEGRVENWRDYDGEQLQITIDGNTYLVSSVNVVLSTKPIE